MATLAGLGYFVGISVKLRSYYDGLE